MDESVVDVVAVDPAPEPEATAAPVIPVEPTPESEAKADEVQERLFKQAEVDEIVSKRLARERRALEREFTRQRQPEPQPPTELSLDQFESPEAYAHALAQVEAKQLVERNAVEKARTDTVEAFKDKEESARDKYSDYETVVQNPALPVTSVMAETIMGSEIGPDIAYHLGLHPKDAERISKLPPLLQAKEIGRLEAKLLAEPPVKKTSNAPAPITPIKGKSDNSAVFDTTDPRSIQSMTPSEWIAAENKRELKRAAL